jgi:hypothetical protein
MFCSFDRAPKILRLYGTGSVVLPGDLDWDRLAARFPDSAGSDSAGSDSASGDSAGGDVTGHETARLGTGMDPASRRAIIVVRIDRIADSCGFTVPRMDLIEERDLLVQWAERKSPADLDAYRVKHNTVSIDGLPALG